MMHRGRALDSDLLLRREIVRGQGLRLQTQQACIYSRAGCSCVGSTSWQPRSISRAESLG